MSWWKTALGIGATGGTAAWLLPALGLGLGTFGQIYGARKQGSANRDALAAEMKAANMAQTIALADREESKRQFDIQQAALKADLDARNTFESNKWAASEEERLYDRGLRDARETRRAPFRAASAAALERIPGILASGRATPGMGSLGSFRRG